MAGGTGGIATIANLQYLYSDLPPLTALGKGTDYCPTYSVIKECSSVIDISNIPTSTESTKLIKRLDVSRKTHVSVTVRVYNKEITGGTTLNEITLLGGTTTIASMTSGFSKIAKGSYADYTFRINLNSDSDMAKLGGQFGIRIGKFGSKRRVKYTDSVITSEYNLGHDNTVTGYPTPSIGSYNTTYWLFKNAGNRITLNIYND